MGTTTRHGSPQAQETEPLLSGTSSVESPDARRWKASPYWCIPVILVVNIARGMTVSPKIAVYKEIACRALQSTDSVWVDCNTPEVQARASQIQASVLTLMYILSSVSTGLWSKWGDDRGRKALFSVCLFGFIGMESVFILVSGPISAITDKAEAFILAGPILEGLCGGLSVFNGVMHAYIADCTPDGSRAKIFSTIQGIVFVGLALGPWSTGILSSFIPLNTYSPFYISIGLQVVLLLYVIFLLPESLRKTTTQSAPVQTTETPLSPKPILETLKNLMTRFFAALISPIAIFRPRRVTHGTASRMDVTLTLLGFSILLYICSTAVYPLKYLYGQHIYKWTPNQLGYYMSLLWIARATNLLVIMPFVVSYFKPKMPTNGATSPESIALEFKFDKTLAQASLCVDALADFLIVVSPASSQTLFVLYSCMSSFTSGGNPALHSLGAVCIYALGYGSETGRLFGAIGVLNAIAHSISPTIFAMTYSLTVASHPSSIFLVAAALLFGAVMLLGRLRINLTTVV
ncbi:major facilitator superfamily domain-containing protein [Roridomyces roridus]|uniref:Major facilitator superfamily domain-containing protein n=1 Tax=Roridomyces roridus TaxID=1738132 RepID=A0AAD7CIX7_9AGAR|nr:major facilitator superfamily domain-containing protein [Roridomyces roridus]